MAFQYYMTIQGAKQGKFVGGSNHHKHMGSAPILSFSYGVIAPRDAATGQASGKRQWEPIKIVKQMDGTSQQLYQAKISKEVLTSVSFEFMKTTQEGKESHYNTVELTNGFVQSIEPTHGPFGAPCEEVILAFESSSSNSAGHARLRHGLLLEHEA